MTALVGDTVHWIQDNFVFGQNSKSFFVFRNDLFRSFGIFYPTFDEQNGDFLVPSVKNIARIAKLPYLKSELKKMSLVGRKEGMKEG